MVKINLREYYPQYYTKDVYILVEDDVAEAFEESKRKAKAEEMESYRHRDYRSFDSFSTLESKITKATFSTPLTEIEKKQLSEKLNKGLSVLTEKQQKRIYAHFFLGLSIADIARKEGCAFTTVKESVESGLKRLKNFLKHP